MGSCCVGQVGLKFTVLLPQLLECYRCVPHLTHSYMYIWFFFVFVFVFFAFCFSRQGLTGFSCVSLAVLELALVDQVGLELTDPPAFLLSAGIKGMCHHYLVQLIF